MPAKCPFGRRGSIFSGRDVVRRDDRYRVPAVIAVVRCDRRAAVMVRSAIRHMDGGAERGNLVLTE
jgi:hypothetical protein